MSNDSQLGTDSAEEPPPADSAAPPPPAMPTEPITFEPGTWYSVTTVCLTETCPNLNTTIVDPLVYSNAGQPVIVCGVCGMTRTILAATRLDPQPEMS